MNENQAFSSSLNSVLQRGSVCMKSYITGASMLKALGLILEMLIETKPSFHWVIEAWQTETQATKPTLSQTLIVCIHCNTISLTKFT